MRKSRLKVLNLSKYMPPSRGGIESVINRIEDSLYSTSEFDLVFIANDHEIHSDSRIIVDKNITKIFIKPHFFFKTQPITIHFLGFRKYFIESDIIHLHHPWPSIEFLLACNLDLIRYKKFIITVHADARNTRWRPYASIYYWCIKEIFNQASNVVYTSEFFLNRFKISGVMFNKETVIPLTVDEKFVNRYLSGRTKSLNNRILFVGKLRKYKGLEYLLEAIRELSVELHIVGEGNEKPYLQSIVDKLGIRNKVLFHGELDDQELLRIYGISDLFVLPSIDSSEAFGIVQLEAMCFGLPVINTNVDSGVPYVSKNGVTGLTVNPKDVDDLKHAIQKIINDNTLYTTYSENAIKVSKIFSFENFRKNILFLYKN